MSRFASSRSHFGRDGGRPVVWFFRCVSGNAGGRYFASAFASLASGLFGK